MRNLCSPSSLRRFCESLVHWPRRKAKVELRFARRELQALRCSDVAMPALVDSPELGAEDDMTEQDTVK